MSGVFRFTILKVLLNLRRRFVTASAKGLSVRTKAPPQRGHFWVRIPFTNAATYRPLSSGRVILRRPLTICKNGLLSEVLHFEEGCQYFCRTLFAIAATNRATKPYTALCVSFCALVRTLSLTEGKACANIETRVQGWSSLC